MLKQAKARKTGVLVTDDLRMATSRMRDQAKKVLAYNLKRALIEAGIHPAELARRCRLTRDNISTYTRGSSLAPEENIIKMARALGVAPEKLLPNRHDFARSIPDAPDVVISHMPNGISRLQIDRVLSTELANKIVAMVQKADNDNKAD